MLTLSVSRALVGSTSGSSPRCYTCCDETRTASCVARLLKVVVLWRSKYIKTNLWDVLCCVTRSSMGFFTYAWSVAVNQVVFSELSSECCLCFHVGLGRRAWGRGVWGASLNHSVWRPGLSKHDVHFEEYVQLCDVSEQTPHLPSWLLTCTRESWIRIRTLPSSEALATEKCRHRALGRSLFWDVHGKST